MEYREVYFGCEQPATCPNCGNRTIMIDETVEYQLHSCLALSCASLFILEFESEQ